MKSVQNFLTFVSKETQPFGIEIVLEDSEVVQSGPIRCSGYFTDEGNNPSLVVARKKPLIDWLKIFVHEFSHAKQWMEQSPVWKDLSVDGLKTKKTDLLDLWLNYHVDLNPRQLQDVFGSILALEQDAESRALALIEEHNLPIDIKEYTQGANAYLLSYEMVKRYRKWLDPRKMAYNIPEVVQAMPTTLITTDKILDLSQFKTELEILEKYCLY